MKTKSIILAIFASLVLLLGNFMRAYGSRNAPITSDKDSYIQLSTVTPYPTSTPGVSERAIQKFARSEVLTNSDHGIEMSATNFRVESGVFKVDVCYQYPGDGDWLVGDATVQIQNNDFFLSEVTGIELTRTLSDGQKKFVTLNSASSPRIIKSDGLPNYRCDTLSFRINSELQVSNVTLTIKYIDALPRDGEGCYEYREAVQSILDSKTSGIKISCEKSENQFTFSRFVVLKKPATMSEEEAKKQIYSAFRDSYTIMGPWVFEGEVTNTANP